jgi:hypothetical protein
MIFISEKPFIVTCVYITKTFYRGVRFAKNLAWPLDNLKVETSEKYSLASLVLVEKLVGYNIV